VDWIFSAIVSKEVCDLIFTVVNVVLPIKRLTMKIAINTAMIVIEIGVIRQIIVRPSVFC